MIIKNPFMQDENLNEMSWPNSYSINDNTGVRDKTAIVQFAPADWDTRSIFFKKKQFLTKCALFKVLQFPET